MRAYWLLLIGLSWPAPALAQDESTRAAARTLGTEGVEAFQEGRYSEAVDKLERAFNVVRAPSIGLWSARALVKAGKWVEAAERYLEVSRLDPNSGDVSVQRQAQADAVKEREALSGKLPSLRIQVRGASANATVTLDGRLLPPALLGAKVPVNPGSHLVELHDGYQHVEQRVETPQSAAVAVMLDASAPGASGPSSRAATEIDSHSAAGLSRLQVTGIVIGSVGAVGLGLSGYFALRAKSFDRQSKQAGRCDENNTCDADGYAQRGDAIDHATAATVSVLAGSVLAAAGLTLVFAGGEKRKTDARVQARPAAGAGLAGVELCGSF
jgi:hypothetical protein